MKSLAAALRSSGQVGEPLPPVFTGLMEAGVDFRRGQLSLIASGPGAGKSAIALTIAAITQVPTLIIAPDSDAYTSFTRLAAMLTGDATSKVEREVEEAQGGDTPYHEVVAKTNEWIRWDFRDNPDIDQIVQSVEAFAHMFGEYPACVIVDNLGDIWSEHENDNVGLKKNLHLLKILAAESGAAVIALHHLTGEYDAGDRPPPLSALIGKVSKPASLVLTLFRGQYGDIGVCIVKNRSGDADPRGHKRVYLTANLTQMRIA